MAKKSTKKPQEEFNYASLIGVVVFLLLVVFDVIKVGKLGFFIDRLGTFLLGPWHLWVFLSCLFIFFYLAFLKNRRPFSLGFFVGLFFLNVALLLTGALINYLPDVMSLKEVAVYFFKLLDFSVEVNRGVIDTAIMAIFLSFASGFELYVINGLLYFIALLLIVPFSCYQAFFSWLLEKYRAAKQERKKLKNQQRIERQITKQSQPPVEQPPVSVFSNEELLIQKMAATTPPPKEEVLEPQEEISAFSRKYFYIDSSVDSDTKAVEQVETIADDAKKLKESREIAPDKPKVHTLKEGLVNEDGKYRLPSNDLLKKKKDARNRINADSANEKGKKIIEILARFGIEAKLLNTYIGPSVTKFEIKPDSSVKVNRILNISDNIKMEIAAKDIRIEAPIPGRNAVGIEIPNVESEMVYMSELMKAYPGRAPKLAFALGKNLLGEAVFCNLAKMPHLLIAGATGSGKSVCINTIISSYLLKSDPDEVKLVLVDPKKVEFTPYHDIPHLLWPVVTDAKMATLLLGRLVGIMDERYNAFSDVGVRNIEGFNEVAAKNEKLQAMPYIVVIIDELADLMLVAGKEVEQHIQRITQLARACGIHMIIATQRPSTDVITGIIKSNIPSRISFAVASSIDSRTILDQVGAERLLGNGDMLYYPTGENSPIRLQGAFLSDEEIYRITDYVKKQAKPKYDDAYFEFERNHSSGGEGFAVNRKEDVDPMYDEVVEYIVQSQKVSTSLLQRRFGFGYNRAARLVDALEEKGVIGPANGSKPREVYLKPDN